MQSDTLSLPEAAAGRASNNLGWTDRKLDSGMRRLLLASFLVATHRGPSLHPAWRGRGHAPGVCLRGLACVLLAGRELLALGTHGCPPAARFLPMSEAPFPLPRVAQTCPLSFLVLFFRAGLQKSLLSFPSPVLTVTKSVLPVTAAVASLGPGEDAAPSPAHAGPPPGWLPWWGGCAHCKVLSRPSAARCWGQPVTPCRGEGSYFMERGHKFH